MYALRQFRGRIFSKSPVYVDYGSGMFGCFQVPAQARRAAAIYRKVMALGDEDETNVSSSVHSLGVQEPMNAQPFSEEPWT